MRTKQPAIKPFKLTIPLQGRDTEVSFWDLDAGIGPDRYDATMFIAISFAEGMPDGCRCNPPEKARGDLPSKTLALLVEGSAIGAWTLFTIDFLRRGRDTVYVSAKFSPALPGKGTDSFDEAVSSILAQIEGRELEIIGGGNVVIERWGFPEDFPDDYRVPFRFKDYLAAVERGEVI